MGGRQDGIVREGKRRGERGKGRGGSGKRGEERHEMLNGTKGAGNGRKRNTHLAPLRGKGR